MRPLLLLFVVAFAGCAETGRKLMRGNTVAAVTFYDFNRDGRVDFELHRPRGKGPGELDWAREDTDHDGYYDKHIGYGATIQVEEDIHMPVPRIEFKEPRRDRRR